MFPDLGRAQLAGGELANDSTRANAAMTGANAAMREASAKEKEFAYATSDETAYRHYLDSAAHGGQQPMSFQDWKATQSLTQSGAPGVPQVAARIQFGTPVGQAIDMIASTNPGSEQIKQFAASMAGKISVADLMAYRDQIQPAPGSFSHSIGAFKSPSQRESDALRATIANRILAHMLGHEPAEPGAGPGAMLNPFPAFTAPLGGFAKPDISAAIKRPPN
jgi:hypothetical protein